MTVAPARRRKQEISPFAPRLAPPLPLHSRIDEYRATAEEVGIFLMPHQIIAATYLTATGPDGWAYKELADILARRNGKTEILVPRIIMDLREGRNVLHTAQNRSIPRKIFFRVHRGLPAREIRQFRQANGQEVLVHRSGAEYEIVAPKRGSRGLGTDTLIFDELREFEDFETIGAATPTLTDSPDPQTIYLSNAGTEHSVVLNDLRRRGEGGDEPDLAYLEWSASPDRAIADRIGWAEANPIISIPVDERPARFRKFEENLEQRFRSLPASKFETEHLCRWVPSMREVLVSEAAWLLCRGEVGEPEVRPCMAFNAAPDGKRASAVMSWLLPDGRVALVELREAVGDPIDADLLGEDLRELAVQHRAKQIGYASWTDAALARHIPKAEAVDAKEFAAATANFVQLVQSGRLVWDSCGNTTEDLGWSARKAHEASGSYTAIPAAPERPITAVLAAIRATWLASAPKPPVPRIG